MTFPWIIVKPTSANMVQLVIIMKMATIVRVWKDTVEIFAKFLQVKSNFRFYLYILELEINKAPRLVNLIQGLTIC